MYALLAGTVGDKYGRKGLIFLSVMGQILASLSYALNYILLHHLPWQFLYLELLNDVCGTYVSYYLAVYSFIAYITTPDRRFLIPSFAHLMINNISGPTDCLLLTVLTISAPVLAPGSVRPCFSA